MTRSLTETRRTHGARREAAEARVPVDCADVLDADDGGVGVIWVPEADVPRARDVLERRRP